MQLWRIGKLRLPPAGGVTFADESARALLADHFAELADPAKAGWDEVKHNASRTVYRGSISGRRIYLKHYHSRTVVHQLGRLLGISDAKTEMRFAKRLMAGGVGTVPVLAAACTPHTEWLAMLAVETLIFLLM